jgi:hypothetical protein
MSIDGGLGTDQLWWNLATNGASITPASLKVEQVYVPPTGAGAAVTMNLKNAHLPITMSISDGREGLL